METRNHENIFIKIGGINALHDIVDLFYDKVLHDDRVNFFFKDADMNVQRGKMKAFLMMALGGPVKFTGKDMRHAHTRLVAAGLNDTHFDVIGTYLEESLHEYGVSQDIRSEVSSVLESVRNDVLNR